MSEAETTHHSPLGDGYVVGIICFCMIIGGIAVWISLYPPEAVGTSPFTPPQNTEKCGEGTFYHPMTNKCETFRPLQPFETEDNSEMIADIERTIRDIRLDTDGERMVQFDENGIPVVSCSAYENEFYSIDENCQMTLK
jgi:hypothetical protein